ncbi:hypothetical protein BMF94_6409 [Rhodotorula taiwanensis]|uniref:Uncharacterized protein n=1 Tax=Rhodotorula taiwanensis TaxID=741276 RepID=A0A2S5B1G6_9BASI|nr:hypothetical protein BMF94_6409 [Rhodotorula taiwanensis]
MPDEGSEVKEAVQLLSLATLSDTSLSVSKKEASDFRTSLDDWAARAKKHLIKLSLVKDDLDLVAKNGKLGKAIQKLVEEVAALHPLEQGDQRAMHLKFLQELAARSAIFFLIHPQDFKLVAQFVRSRTEVEALRKRAPLFHLLSTAEPLRPVYTVVGLLLLHARQLWKQLVANSQQSRPLSPDELELVSEHDFKGHAWQTTGAIYPDSPVRSRPLYKRIPGDAGMKRLKNLPVIDATRNSDECNKLYSTYGKNGLTGGMMGLWCPHGVCIGAHLMSSAEGRDEVFSALFTRRKKAPNIVIYDFSCQLGPYCWIRAPEYFAETRFYVDQLHSYNHTDCAKSAQWASAVRADPDLKRINTSLAETAHATLRRIKKSISYMLEMHAILFLWVSIQLFNRRKLRKMGHWDRHFPSEIDV